MGFFLDGMEVDLEKGADFSSFYLFFAQFFLLFVKKWYVLFCIRPYHLMYFNAESKKGHRNFYKH